MKVLFILALVTWLGACISKPESGNNTAQKITVTGTRIERSEMPPGPKLKMSVNKKNESSNFMQALAGMESLPKPKNIGDCKGLLLALTGSKLAMRIVDENNVVLESEHGIYEYSFDDSSCPTNET